MLAGFGKHFFLSETEVEIVGLNVCILLGSLGFQVDRIAFNVYGLDRADVFTAAATYAKIRSGFGDGKSTLKRNHVNGLYGTMLGACTATGTVYVNHADIFVEYYASGLGVVFLLDCKRADGAGGAYLAAEVAVVVAITVIKFHDRLHQASKAVFHTCGLEHM